MIMPLHHGIVFAAGETLSKGQYDSENTMRFEKCTPGYRYFPSVTGGRLRNRTDKSSLITYTIMPVIINTTATQTRQSRCARFQ